MHEPEPDEVMVVIDHPFGPVETTLARWMETGPGPRPGVRPVSARSRSTGEALPLTVIPLPYRNDEESRSLIARGLLTSPWEHTGPAPGPSPRGPRGEGPKSARGGR